MKMPSKTTNVIVIPFRKECTKKRLGKKEAEIYSLMVLTSAKIFLENSNNDHTCLTNPSLIALRIKQPHNLKKITTSFICHTSQFKLYFFPKGNPPIPPIPPNPAIFKSPICFMILFNPPKPPICLSR